MQVKMSTTTVSTSKNQIGILYIYIYAQVINQSICPSTDNLPGHIIHVVTGRRRIYRHDDDDDTVPWSDDKWRELGLDEKNIYYDEAYVMSFC